MNKTMKDRMQTPEASRYIGVTPPTLRKMVRNGTGPKHYRVGDRVSYTPNDLDAFIESCAVDPAA